MTATPDLTPMEQRLQTAVFALWGAVPEDVRAELLALRDLEPDGFQGISVAHAPGVLEVWFTGRRLGVIDRHWLLTGVEPPTT